MSTRSTAKQARTAADRLLRDFRDGIGDDLNTLATLHDAEPDATTLAGLKQVGFPTNLALRLRSKEARGVMDVMSQVIEKLPETPGQQLLDDLAADYAHIYLTHGARAAPMESVWLDEDHLVRQQPMFKVRDLYRQHGLTVVDWANRSDDHLVTELKFLAHLFLEGKSEDWDKESATFLDEHLLRWIKDFAAQVSRHGKIEFFAVLCLLTAVYLDELRDVLSEVTGEPRPSREEIEKRENAEAGCLCSGELKAPANNPLTGPTW